MNYDYMPDLYMLFTVIDLFVWYKLIKQEYQKRELKKRQIPDAIVTVAAVFACIPLVNGTYQKIYSETGQFSKDSYLAELLDRCRRKNRKLSRRVFGRKTQKKSCRILIHRHYKNRNGKYSKKDAKYCGNYE